MGLGIVMMVITGMFFIYEGMWAELIGLLIFAGGITVWTLVNG